ncbi:peptide ABC transporter substrate-binding protein [Brucella endophytica]|uniref:Peptide ABC transporter substrate-binding protein n=1 Tax=Brucella endophytica TaxID=1963359 RepID=A0A916SKZ4_9HYPH|nr:FecR family protein [Brucella endophytica]GGB05609.1 peptide ABC transporter substrate-binding protein [Brucella endophytica]
MIDRDTDAIFTQALEWFVLLKEDSATAGDRLAFEQWLAASELHEAAYRRAEHLWSRFDVVKPSYEQFRKTKRISRRNVVLGGLAAAVAAPSLYGLSRPGMFAEYKTDIAERRLFTLPDGSTAELGSHTAMSLDFRLDARRVRLYRGQAFFTVASDATRPFIVGAAQGNIRALGTKFDVKVASDAGLVSVLEHAVELRVDDEKSGPVVIEQDWQASYGPGGIQPLKKVDPGIVEAWRQDRIVFKDVPLRRVLAELERYRRGRILLLDDAMGDIPVTAVFDSRRASDALQIIADILPIRVVNPDGYLAVVYSR